MLDNKHLPLLLTTTFDACEELEISNCCGSELDLTIEGKEGISSESSFGSCRFVSSKES